MSPKSIQHITSPHTTFHLFTSLPVELRQYIWALSLPGPRINRIGRVSDKRPPRSSCLVPNTMLVCREARNEALRHLKRLNLPSILSGDSDSNLTIFQPASQCSYFNPAIDTVFIPGESRTAVSEWGPAWLSGSDNTDFSLVRHIAFDVSWVQSYLFPDISIGEVVRLMGHVEVLHLISIDGLWDDRYCHWHDLERHDRKNKSEFSWVDIDEVKCRQVGWRSRIWADWGPMSATALGGPDCLSLEGKDAMARYTDVIGQLQSERIRWPDGWNFPKVQLDFVRYDMIEKKMPVWASGKLPEPTYAANLWWKRKFMEKLRKRVDRGKALRNRVHFVVVDGIRNAGLGFKRTINLQGWIDLFFKSTWLARAGEGRYNSRTIET